MTTDVLAFYKGTLFPKKIKVNPSDWKTMSKSWDECIVVGLRDGVDIKTQIRDYFYQLNRIELFFNKFYKKHCPSKMTNKLQKKLEQDLQTELGEDIDTIQGIWYMDIYILMRLKQIENNNDNGWLFTRKDNIYDLDNLFGM